MGGVASGYKLILSFWGRISWTAFCSIYKWPHIYINLKIYIYNITYNVRVTHTHIYIYTLLYMFIHILLYSILCYSQFGLAWPCFGRQRGSLIFHRSALHKLLNLCLSLFPEVPTASSEMDLKSGSGIKQLKSQAFSVPPGRIPRPPQQCLAPTSAPPP
jgi:hypothetical protein